MLFKNTLLPVSFFAVSAIASPLDHSAGGVMVGGYVAARFSPALMANGPEMAGAVPAIKGGEVDPALVEAVKKAFAAKGADAPVKAAGATRAVKASPELVAAVKADPEFLEALMELNKVNGGELSPGIVEGLRDSDPALFAKIDKLRHEYVADKRIVAKPHFTKALKEVVTETKVENPKVLVEAPKPAGVPAEVKVDPKLVLAVKNVHEANGRVIKGHQVNLEKQADILRMQAAQIREHGKKLGAAVSKANASLAAAATLVTVTTKTSTSTTVVTPTVVFAEVSPTPKA